MYPLHLRPCLRADEDNAAISQAWANIKGAAGNLGTVRATANPEENGLIYSTTLVDEKAVGNKRDPVTFQPSVQLGQAVPRGAERKGGRGSSDVAKFQGVASHTRHSANSKTTGPKNAGAAS